MSLEAALESARSSRDRDLADLAAEVSIPSVSALPEHRADVERNGLWLVERLRGLGFEANLHRHPEGQPLVVAEWQGRPEAPWLTVYGHYDVQPADPVEEWLTPPFQPTLEAGYLVGRGAADSKVNHLAAIKAAEHWMAAGGPPVNLRFLIEGEEEGGGPTLPDYLRGQGAGRPADHVLVWDGGFGAGNVPAVVTGLRGMCYTELHLRGAAVDLHSGSFGGVAPNPLNTLGHIIHGLKSPEGRIQIPGFYDGIARPSAEEVEGWEEQNRPELLMSMMGTETLEGEPDQPPAIRRWARPTLDVHGIKGGFTGEGTKTVIPAQASAKISMRLIPGQDPEQVFERFRARVQELTTPGVKVEVRFLGGSQPVLAGTDHVGVRAYDLACRMTFGRGAIKVRTGGSIPVASVIQETMPEARMLIGGLAQPGAGAHSPNERVLVDNYHQGIEMLIRWYANLATA